MDFFWVSFRIFRGFFRNGRDDRDGGDGQGSPQGYDLYRPGPTNVDTDPAADPTHLDSDPPTPTKPTPVPWHHPCWDGWGWRFIFVYIIST